jgi:hypothetical protein
VTVPRPRTIERSQDAAITQLPTATRTFCEAKGRLYLAIKDINSAGHTLHAGDLEAAAKYNLKVLYPRGHKSKAEVTGTTTTTTTTTAK